MSSEARKITEGKCTFLQLYVDIFDMLLKISWIVSTVSIFNAS